MVEHTTNLHCSLKSMWPRSRIRFCGRYVKKGLLSANRLSGDDDGGTDVGEVPHETGVPIGLALASTRESLTQF